MIVRFFVTLMQESIHDVSRRERIDGLVEHIDHLLASWPCPVSAECSVSYLQMLTTSTHQGGAPTCVQFSNV